MSKENPMREIIIEKITLNIGAGKDDAALKKGIALLKKFSSLEPVKTLSKKRIPTWGLRPGLPIGCKLTLRRDTLEVLKKLLAAKENRLSEKNFDIHGNLAFGVPEYIDIPGFEYDPELKIMGLEVAVTLGRKGYRVKRRKIRKAPIGKKHEITRNESIAFIKELGVEVEA